MKFAKYFEYYAIILRGGRFFVDTLYTFIHHVSCLYRDTVVRCSVVGPFLWLAQRPGTCYQTNVGDPSHSVGSFCRDLKTFLFLFY